MTIDLRILGGLVVLLIAAFAALLIANANLRTEVAIARTESAALHIDNAAFKAAVEKQNQAVAMFQAAAANHSKRAAQAEKYADATAKRFIKAAAELQQRMAKGGDCAATEQLINDYLANIK